jgi:hypothetical protein
MAESLLIGGDGYTKPATAGVDYVTPAQLAAISLTPGPQGQTGPQGPQGIKGDTGDTGPQGLQGIQGVKGDTGDAGPQGIQGAQGPQGLPGANGTDGQQGIQGPPGNDGAQGPAGVSNYTIAVQALTSSPADATTYYFGVLPKAPTTTANISKVYIRRTGTIKAAEIYTYSGTAGTAEAWSFYIRLNNTTDTLIATQSVATSERVFSNASLNIAAVAGNYFEIKCVCPTWATNPLTSIWGGYIYIE